MIGQSENRSERTNPKGGPEAATSKRLPSETHAASVCFYPIPPFAPDDFSDRFVPLFAIQFPLRRPSGDALSDMNR